MSDPSNPPSSGQSLGGNSNEPLPTAWSRPSVPRGVGRIGNWDGTNSSSSRSGAQRIATLGDIGSSGAPPAPSGHSGHGHSSSDDDDDERGDAEKDEGESWFAGGERRYVVLAFKIL